MFAAFFKKPTISPSMNHRQVLFSWALSEAFSPRWREMTMASATANLRSKLQKNLTENYTESEQDELIAIMKTRVKRTELVERYINNAISFSLVEMPVELLETIPVLPDISYQDTPLQISQFMAGDYNPESKHDPRVLARKFIKQPFDSVYSGHPIISYCSRIKSNILLEGYSRVISAIWSWQEGRNVQPVKMIYCHHER